MRSSREIEKTKNLVDHGIFRGEFVLLGSIIRAEYRGSFIIDVFLFTWNIDYFFLLEDLALT